MGESEDKKTEQPQGFVFLGTMKHVEGEERNMKSMSLGSELSPSQNLGHT